MTGLISLRLGHLAALTIHRIVIHSRSAVRFAHYLQHLAPKASALPVATKPLPSCAEPLGIAKLLPLLTPRCIRHRRYFGDVPNCATPRYSTIVLYQIFFGLSTAFKILIQQKSPTVGRGSNHFLVFVAGK